MRGLCETATLGELRVGMTVTSSARSTSVIVLQVGDAWHAPSTEGREMVPGRPTPCGMRVRRGGLAAKTVAGRRYVDPPTGLRVLCTRSGSGSLSYDGRRMVLVTPRAVKR